jgi:hypothetical protein
MRLKKVRVSALYAAAYERSDGPDVDKFGDLDAFHDEAESDRIQARSGKTEW